MSAVTDRLTDDDVHWLARMTRVIHARAAARLERERLDRERAEGDPLDDAGDGAHDAA